ncbi:MAG TPA: energy transducer TonB [Candidatus Cybelea sp.]|jgi:TonB family protein|nr:energy transducer TonB [Candidatus Cybelea sp.]
MIALLTHPQRPDFQSQTETVSVVRRSSIAVHRPTPPPPRPTQTPAPHKGAPPQPHARTGTKSAAPTGGGTRRAPTPAPPVPTPQATLAAAGCVSPNAVPAVVSSPPPPDIPVGVRADATSGTAMVSVQLDATGQVTGASVAQSTGNASLDLVAVAMARGAQYSAALHDCKPIAGTATFSVKFVAW